MTATPEKKCCSPKSGRFPGTLLATSFFGWLVTSTVLFLLSKLQADQSGHPMAYQGPAIALVIIFSALPITLAATAMLGPQWYAHASKDGVRSAWAYLMAGSVRGTAVGGFCSVLFLLSFGFAWWALAVLGIVYSAAIGASTGLFAWLSLRPDRDTPNPAIPAP